MSQPIPVVCCGRRPAIATAVKAGLLPEFEVIHVILSPEAGASEIPIMLRGAAPLPIDAENVGTKNYAKAPAAIITGGGYEDAQFSEMKDACKEVSNVPWMRPDMSKVTPPMGPAYGAVLVERLKARLGELAKEGKMTGDGVYFY